MVPLLAGSRPGRSSSPRRPENLRIAFSGAKLRLTVGNDPTTMRRQSPEPRLEPGLITFP